MPKLELKPNFQALAHDVIETFSSWSSRMAIGSAVPGESNYNAKKSELDAANAGSGLREQVDMQAVNELVPKVVSHFHENGSVPAYVEPQCNRAGGHEWVADTTDVECVNCGYVKMGSDT